MNFPHVNITVLHQDRKRKRLFDQLWVAWHKKKGPIEVKNDICKSFYKNRYFKSNKMALMKEEHVNTGGMAVQRTG